MNTWRRLTCGFVLLSGGLAWAACAEPEWLTSSTSGVKPGEQRTLAGEVRLAQSLEYRKVVVRQRLRAKLELTRQLLDGELSLFEVAAWFRYLNAHPDCQDNFREAQPGKTEEEKLCRQVIVWAASRAREESPSQGEALARQLEQELQRHMDCNGGVILPEL